MENASKFISLLLALVLLSAVGSAEDKLKPLIDSFFNLMKAVVDAIAELVFEVFPGLEESINNLLSGDPLWPISDWAPWIRSLYWLFYIALFFAIMAIIAKLWGMGKHFIVNTIVGILLLLILIHVLGVEMEISLLKLTITAIFGIPGVIFILILHYLGVPL